MHFSQWGSSGTARYRDGPESDERSKKIGAYGLSYAWLTGILFMSALFWLDFMGILRMGTQGALGLSVMVLAISAVLYQMYLFRKGDVELKYTGEEPRADQNQRVPVPFIHYPG